MKSDRFSEDDLSEGAIARRALFPAPAPVDASALEPRDKLRGFIRSQIAQGHIRGCRVLSDGEACGCLLCAVDQLAALAAPRAPLDPREDQRVCDNCGVAFEWYDKYAQEPITLCNHCYRIWTPRAALGGGEP